MGLGGVLSFVVVMADRPRLAFDALEGDSRRPQPGARLGRYELIARIGAGGMAEVWMARLQGTAGFSKLVAIKMILPHLASVDEARHMLFDEARVAARINHPNVVSIQELSEEDGIPFVVMDWVDGLPLDRLVSALSPLQPAHAARIVADAALGLHAAHELVDDAGRLLHVVHRDISPFNIIVGRTGTVQVADFGIVKLRGQVHRTTALGDVRGRVPYMAPEQITGKPVDRRADVFALGATLHEILTGELAFSGNHDAQIIYQITERGYEPPGDEAPPGAAGLFEIVSRALKRSPDDRFANAEEMRVALESWLTDHAPPVITSSTIAELVRERAGADLERRDAQLRAALAVKRGTQPNLQLTLQGVAEVPPAALRERGSSRSPGVVLAALTIALAAIGWVSFARRTSSEGGRIPVLASAAPSPEVSSSAPSLAPSIASAVAPSLPTKVAESPAASQGPRVTTEAKSVAPRRPVPLGRPAPLPIANKKASAPAVSKDEIPANPY